MNEVLEHYRQFITSQLHEEEIEYTIQQIIQIDIFDETNPYKTYYDTLRKYKQTNLITELKKAF